MSKMSALVGATGRHGEAWPLGGRGLRSQEKPVHLVIDRDNEQLLW